MSRRSGRRIERQAEVIVPASRTCIAQPRVREVAARERRFLESIHQVAERDPEEECDLVAGARGPKSLEPLVPVRDQAAVAQERRFRESILPGCALVEEAPALKGLIDRGCVPAVEVQERNGLIGLMADIFRVLIDREIAGR